MDQMRGIREKVEDDSSIFGLITERTELLVTEIEKGEDQGAF